MTAESAVRPPLYDRWVLRPEVLPDVWLRLVCVPYAGGGAAAFHGWSALLPPGVEQWTLRLPGRDSRMREPAATDLTALAADAAEALAARLQGPFAVFGHSLGAFIALETVRALEARWGLRASLLAVSGRAAPQSGHHTSAVHRLPDDAFLETLHRRYRAVPKEVLDDPEMRRLFLPVLRADVTMLETYRFRAGRPLGCPVSVYGGVDDTETRAGALTAWGELTTGGSTVRLLPGGHFFPHTARARLLRLLSGDLVSTLVP
ncbi:thioesterase II family protein [Streptomyces sp. NPDC055078]